MCGTGIGRGRGLDARRWRVRARMYHGFCRNVRENESRSMCGRKGKDVLCCIGAKPISRILRSQHMPVLYPWRSCWIKRRRRDVAQFWHFRPVVRHNEQRPVHSYDILQHGIPYKPSRQHHPLPCTRQKQQQHNHLPGVCASTFVCGTSFPHRTNWSFTVTPVLKLTPPWSCSPRFPFPFIRPKLYTIASRPLPECAGCPRGTPDTSPSRHSQLPTIRSSSASR